ncbi:hypothetical protein N431DRAFT_425086 [Stipitochalara longipes BDJ]|nr:hypothetical protein N431DRAFT_425086 [Stipitochalara longipes BDJ]
MTLPKPKFPGRIEIWRHEVASFTPTETEYLQPLIRQPSFWKKIMRRDSKSSSSGKSKLKSQGDGKDSVKTEMYEEKGVDDGLRVLEHGGELGRESSMEIASGESELGGFRERKERLERAAKLLNESGKGKEDKNEKKVG